MAIKHDTIEKCELNVQQAHTMEELRNMVVVLVVVLVVVTLGGMYYFVYRRAA